MEVMGYLLSNETEGLLIFGKQKLPKLNHKREKHIKNIKINGMNMKKKKEYVKLKIMSQIVLFDKIILLRH